MIERSVVVQQALDLFRHPDYLEIGVDRGDTFGRLLANRKVAVDPKFKFVPPLNTYTVEYHAVGSDEYFSSRCPAGRYFDVVYIDGLHTFEQTLRDVLNSVLRLKRDGVIIVDDILPASYQSAMPSLEEAFLVRDHLAGDRLDLKADNTWMGDVYKLAFFIQTFMPQLSYGTVQENHGQLIVWPSTRRTKPVVQRSILEIALLNFSDTIVKRATFQIQPLDAILDDIKTSQVASEAPPVLNNSAEIKHATTYVSCGPGLLYRDGGDYSATELAAEMERVNCHPDFVTDVGELFPSFGCARAIDRNLLFGSPAFIETLLTQYAAINATFARGAATRIYRLSDVFVHQNTIHHIADDKVVTVYETDRPNDRPSRNKTVWTPEQLRSSACEMVLDYPCLYLGSAGWFNYGHWLVDDLPRAEAIDAITLHSGSFAQVQIVVPEFTPVLDSVKRQSLVAFWPAGPDDCIRFVSSNQILHFNDLYFVSPTSYHPTMKSPDACRLLRVRGRQIFSDFAESFASTPARVYIIRSRSRGRRIINQAEVTGVFEAFNFAVVDVEGLTFAQQVAAFRGGRIVAGCMGAAMTNTVFCEPGTIVLELAPEGWTEPFYWDLACACDHIYAAVFGSATDPRVPPHQADFTIDTDLLSDALRQLLAE